MRRANSLEKTLILGKTEGRGRRGQQSLRWLNGVINSTDVSLSTLRKIEKGRKTWRTAVHAVAREPNMTE